MVLVDCLALLTLSALTSAAYVGYPYPAGHATSYASVVRDYGTPIHPGYVYPKYYPHRIYPGYGIVNKGYDNYNYPRYQFKYGVNDPHTGDFKNQEEIRDGDVVKGSYSLAEPDGTIRTVHYTADDHNGFNAVVSKSGHAIHPAPIYEKPYVDAPLYGHY